MEIKTSWEIKEWVEDIITRDYLDWNEIHYDRFGKEYKEVHERDQECWVRINDIKKLIGKGRQEAHLCYSSAEVLDWIDWFEKKLVKEPFNVMGSKTVKKVIEKNKKVLKRLSEK